MTVLFGHKFLIVLGLPSRACCIWWKSNADNKQANWNHESNIQLMVYEKENREPRAKTKGHAGIGLKRLWYLRIPKFQGTRFKVGFDFLAPQFQKFRLKRSLKIWKRRLGFNGIKKTPADLWDFLDLAILEERGCSLCFVVFEPNRLRMDKNQVNQIGDRLAIPFQLTKTDDRKLTKALIRLQPQSERSE